MSTALERALAALDGDALAPQTRRIRHPRTGRFCTIEMAGGLWRDLDALALLSGQSPAALCRRALRDHPEAEPAEALWRLLFAAFIRR
jgi:hypothetical protein